MTSRIWKSNVKAFDNEVKMLAGLITIDSDGYVTSDTITGATASRTDATTYTITLDDAFSSLLHVGLSVIAATAVDLVPQVKSQDLSASSKTVVFRLLAGASPTAPSAALKVSVLLIVKDSSV